MNGPDPSPPLPDAARGTRRVAPEWVVAAVASVVAIGHGIWIWQHRRVGAIDPDEAGYLANALRYHRTLTDLDLAEFVRAVGGSATGPVVPLLSLPFLLVGPRDPRTAMLVQPALLVAIATMVCSLTRRLSTNTTAVVAGLAVLALPTFALGAQSYWLGMGAATMTAAAALSLLRSERLTNRWTWAFGVFVALLLMSRSMAAAFVPGLALAALLAAGRDRRRLLRLAGALGLTAALAGPWWLLNRSAILGYLLDYGYGARAAQFGSGSVVDRFGFRIERIWHEAGLDGPFGWPVAVALSAGALALLRQGLAGRRAPDRAGPRPEPSGWARSDATLLAVPALAGFAALLSTTNAGVWFELPVLVLAVPLAAALVQRAPRPLGMVSTAAVATVAVGVLATTWWLVPARDRWWNFGIIGAHYEGAFRLYDERFDADRRDELERAAADWAALNRRAARQMRDLDRAEGGVSFTISGNTELINNNTLVMAAELDGWQVRFNVPDTTGTVAELSAELSPRRDAGRHGILDRRLVIARHDLLPFPADLDWERFADLARSRGWEEIGEIPLPVPGSVTILAPDGTLREREGGRTR